MLKELSGMELGDVFAAFDMNPEDEKEPEDDNDFEVNVADYEFDVQEGDDGEFQEICAAFIKARRELSRLRPKRKYKYRPAAIVRRFQHGVHKGGQEVADKAEEKEAREASEADKEGIRIPSRRTTPRRAYRTSCRTWEWRNKLLSGSARACIPWARAEAKDSAARTG